MKRRSKWFTSSTPKPDLVNEAFDRVMKEMEISLRKLEEASKLNKDLIKSLREIRDHQQSSNSEEPSPHYPPNIVQTIPTLFFRS